MATRRSTAFKKKQKKLRDEASFRQGHRCCYCRAYVPEGQRTAEHAIPVVRGGKNSRCNVFMACIECNAKAAKALQRNGYFRRHVATYRSAMRWLKDNPGVLPPWKSRICSHGLEDCIICGKWQDETSPQPDCQNRQRRETAPGESSKPQAGCIRQNQTTNE